MVHTIRRQQKNVWASYNTKYSLCDCKPYLSPTSIPLLSSLLVQDDPAKSCEDVPGQARHKDQVHPDISAEEPAIQRRHLEKMINNHRLNM